MGGPEEGGGDDRERVLRAGRHGEAGAEDHADRPLEPREEGPIARHAGWIRGHHLYSHLRGELPLRFAVTDGPMLPFSSCRRSPKFRPTFSRS